MGESPLDGEPLFEFEHAAHRRKHLRVADGVVVGFEHADEVGGVRDLRPEAFAEGFAVGAPAEVVIAARSGRPSDDVKLAGVANERDPRLLFGVELVDAERLHVDPVGIHGLECLLQPAQVVRAQGGGDGEVLG